VSVGDIARKAGVSHVTIYNRFGSKESLIRSVAKTQILSAMDKYKEILDSDMPFLEKLETMVFNKGEIAGEFQGELLQAVIRTDAETQRLVESIWNTEVPQVLSRFLEEGKREGYIDPELSQESFNAYVTILRNGFFNSPEIIADMARDGKLIRDLIFITAYGLDGKRDS
jgi:AcrR family transcriptional regulator